MANKPKISVCMPTYNKAQHVAEAIQSVLDQTFGDFELIIVDDASSDNSAEIIGRFNDPRIKFSVNEKNIGMAQNWNRSISLASGQYIAILHGDDRYLQNFLETESEFLDQNREVGLVHSACTIIDENGKIMWTHKLKEMSNYGLFRTARDKKTEIASGRDFLREIIFDDFVRFPTVMVRKECYEKVGLYSTEFKLGTDWNMWMRIALEGYKIGYIDEPLAEYRKYAKNQTSFLVSSGESSIDDFKVVTDMLNEAKEKNVFSKKEEKKIFHHIVRDALADRFHAIWLLLKQGNREKIREEFARLKLWRDQFGFNYDLEDIFFSLLKVKL